MAPVATNDAQASATNGATDGPVKAAKKTAEPLFNPFYSPTVASDKDDSDYKYAKYKPFWPDVKWEPLTEFPVTDVAHRADPEKKSLLSAASKVTHYTPAIGTELSGIDLRQLSASQKDELALLVAERGVVFFRDQEISIQEQLELARHFGPLHKHATTPIPREPGLEEVHVVYNDGSRRPDPSAFSKIDLWHSDVSYELQPPSTTSLKVITGPPYGGDTLWSSGYALYSSFSPGFQKYLEGLTAVHSGVAQADGARAAGQTVRREPVESVHPIVRVHPVTGYKSIYVNPGFTRRIIGVPKAESDAILSLLFHQLSENPDFQVRFHWEPNSIAFWDNRIVTHSATFDFFPHTRHALRATPHGERPTSVADFEAQTGRVAKDWQRDVWAKQGIAADVPASTNRPKGYND
ncbi:TauD-domain-containing protein [Lentinus tigrinus ALCF2SS1-7]|uniref:TauD-domain-containing protein n=1 Tax=Lentinus tigrinus ALCF2SS1-6 TaxID=1328759 RepID=A0A5C2SFR7_9APHY|nr:TauD-domain-containing protein [Lentinus tigrinus ALCF2SS1-6]RPD74911.1 TauD-domain-containing protein [Lentinus tigrinus ALCF2SS1-7]